MDGSMKKDLKSIGWYVTGDVWSASVTRGSHDAYKKEYQANVGWVADSHRINAERICNGERVGECWLRGRLKQELLDFGLLTRSDFFYWCTFVYLIDAHVFVRPLPPGIITQSSTPTMA